MNTNESDEVLPGSDQISEAYRAAGFDEAPPAELDRAILAEAERRSRRSPFSFLPPLALAATVVLSVSLVLRSGVLNENTEVFSDAILSDMPNATPPAAVTIEQGADAMEPESLDSVVTGTSGFSANETEADFDTPVAPEAPAPVPAAAETELRARQAQPVRRQEAAEQSPQVEALSLESVVLEEAVASSAALAALDCSAIDTEIADDWLACIEAGIEQGQIDAARQELEAFLVVYPEYSLPEELDILQ